MISELLAGLVASLVVNPVQAEIAETMERTGQPIVVIEQAKGCVSSQGPKLIERASTDWGWAASTAIGVSVGWTDPKTLLDVNDPSCAATLKALKGEKASGA